jgi:hypothetical protein
MGIVDELISSQGSELLASLTGQAGLSAQQAEKFLPAATEQVVSQVKGGGFDLASLLGGDGIGSLISKLDIASLASQVGIPESLASGGLQALVPVLLSALQGKAGGAEGILSLLGGDDAGGALGAVGKLAGGLFKS